MTRVNMFMQHPHNQRKCQQRTNATQEQNVAFFPYPALLWKFCLLHFFSRDLENFEKIFRKVIPLLNEKKGSRNSWDLVSQTRE